MSEKFRKTEKEVPKLYETKAVLYKCTAVCDNASQDPQLEEVARHNILVNQPLDYKGLMAYQYDYKLSPVLISVTPTLKNKETGQAYGSFTLNMGKPEDQYTAGEYSLKLKGYFPEFGLDGKGTPVTKSNEAKAPAFIFNISGPGLAEGGEPYIYFPRQVDKVNFRQDDLNGKLAQTLDISVDSMDKVKFAEYTTFLNIRVDRAIPFIWTGAAISMAGLIMGFYWQHRRIWLRVDGRRLTLGAHTNKNWFAIRKEVSSALEKTGIRVNAKILERGRQQ